MDILNANLNFIGEALGRGMVLAMSLWDDADSNLLWLDSNLPSDGNPLTPGVARYVMHHISAPFAIMYLRVLQPLHFGITFYHTNYTASPPILFSYLIIQCH